MCLWRGLRGQHGDAEEMCLVGDRGTGMHSSDQAPRLLPEQEGRAGCPGRGSGRVGGLGWSRSSQGDVFMVPVEESEFLPCYRFSADASEASIHHRSLTPTGSQAQEA